MSRPSAVPAKASKSAWIELLPDKSSPACPERSAQGKFPFPLDYAREQQTSEVRRRNQQRTDCSPDDDENFRPQIHHKTFAQRRDVSGTHVRRIRIVAIDRGAHALHSFFRFHRRDAGTQSRDAIEIMVVDRRRIVGLKRKRQPQTRAIRMPECFRHHADDRPWCSIDHDRAAEHVAT